MVGSVEDVVIHMKREEGILIVPDGSLIVVVDVEEGDDTDDEGGVAAVLEGVSGVVV